MRGEREKGDAPGVVLGVIESGLDSVFETKSGFCLLGFSWEGVP